MNSVTPRLVDLAASLDYDADMHDKASRHDHDFLDGYHTGRADGLRAAAQQLRVALRGQQTTGTGEGVADMGLSSHQIVTVG